jgi:hypothetical protein
MGEVGPPSQELLIKYIEQGAEAGATKPVRRAGWE